MPPLTFETVRRKLRAANDFIIDFDIAIHFGDGMDNAIKVAWAMHRHRQSAGR